MEIRKFQPALFILPLVVSFLSGQGQYPADSLLTSPNTGILQKVGILPIAAWQRLSYNTNLIQCQFYPSCSNYGALAIRQNGLVLGSFQAADRIIRCNPMAFHYHLDMVGSFHDTDGRLVDPVSLDTIGGSGKSPVRAALLSAVLPGAGRVYAGRWYDGMLGFLMFSIITTSAINAYQNQQPVRTPILGVMTLIVYGGEIYGAYRTAKYY